MLRARAECSNVPKGKIFAGWEQAAEAPASLAVSNISELEGLKQAGDVITVDMGSNLSYYARYANFYFSGGLGTQASPFQISTTSDWNDLSDAVNSGYNFNGVYLQLTNDISVTTMVGQGDNRFCGNFDGQGYTITVSYTGITEDYCAPFRCISGATIKNLNTTGTIETSSCFAGGVVGYTRYYSTIENCHSSVTIRSSYAGDGGHGGILGLKANVTMSKPTVEGCVFDGKILTTGETATTGCGGIVGWTNEQSLTVKNCLYNPAALGDDETAVACSTIYGEHGGSITCTDCYYTEAYGTAQGTHGYTVTSGIDGLTLNFGDATKTYEYNGVKVYDFGLLYDGTLYSGSGKNVTFTLQAAEEISNVAASGGSLTGPSDGIYTLTMPAADVSITATLGNYEIALYDAQDNTETIKANDDHIGNVTLSGRTLYKDGSWNTLCLPFDMTAAQVTAQLAPSALMELDVNGKYDGSGNLDNEHGTYQTGFDGETLYLYFTDADAIEAGKPYIIRWGTPSNPAGGTIASPIAFSNVEIEGAAPDNVTSTDGKVSFKGIYDPLSVGSNDPTPTGDNTKLYLGTGNQLYYPNSPRTINAFRAYFQLNDGLTAGAPAGVRAFSLHFGDDAETTGIIEAVANSSLFTLHSSLSGWYDLQGRKLDKKPTHAGVYIYNGKKRVIK